MKKIMLILGLLFVVSAYANTKENIQNAVQIFARNQHITSMSVGINEGKNHYVVQYGTEKRYPINSMSKTFATLLIAYYVNAGQLNLNDTMIQYFPQLKGAPIAKAQIVNFATHTTGLPLSINTPLLNRAEVFNYLKNWKPVAPIGTKRVYSNLGIGMLGYLLEKITKQSYPDLVKTIILQPGGMTETSVNPADFHLFNDGNVFIAASGIVSTAQDMNQYLRLMMGVDVKTKAMSKAISTVFKGYYKTPFFIADLGWEVYPWPITEKAFLKSASLKALNSKATVIRYPAENTARSMITRTGSGHGFSSLMALIPQEKTSVVVLVNKEITQKSRMQLVYKLLKKLEVNS